MRGKKISESEQEEIKKEFETKSIRKIAIDHKICRNTVREILKA